MEIWPWAETNQGLLSILALAAALAIALFEYVRAERAEQKRVRDYVSLVDDLLDELSAKLAELGRRSPTRPVLFSDIVGDWNALVGKAYQIVEAIIPAVPPNARLALVMLDVREFFRISDIPIGAPSEGFPDRIVNLSKGLGRLKAALCQAATRG